MCKNFLLFLFVTVTLQLSAQQEDAWVYFVAKENVATALANPEMLLTQRALDRKQRHGVELDARDVPLDQNRITSVRTIEGITVLAMSKWFNCVYVRGTVEDINSLSTLEIVDSIDFADKRLNTSPKRRERLQAKKDSLKSKNKKFPNLLSENYGSSEAQIRQLNANVLHDNGYSGAGMMIAVMDSGFPNVQTMDVFEAARSEGRLLDGYDFVSGSDDEFAFTGSSHGTWTFSDIGAKLPGTFIGTAPDASYRLFRTEDVATEMPVEEAYWVAAAERADSLGVDVINTSLGYNRFDNAAYNYSTSDMNGTTAFISKGATLAFEKGMIPVCSAGNSGGDASWGIITAPADASGAFSVGAVDQFGTYASFSSRGPTADNRIKPDVVARGAQAAVVQPDNSIGALNGTSFSGPIIAGVVACLWQAFPEKTNAEIMQLIRSAASQFSNPDTTLGYGIPDFGIALNGLDTALPSDNIELKLFPNPVQANLIIQLPNTRTPNEVQLFSAEGKFIKQKNGYGKIILNLEDFAPGMYIVQIVSVSNRYIQKIVKN